MPAMDGPCDEYPTRRFCVSQPASVRTSGCALAPMMAPVTRLWQRISAHSTPQYGRLSVALQARFKMKKLFNVSKGAFKPPPKVESAVVRLEPLPEILNIDEDLLRKAFSARRKTLRNALPGVDFAALGIDPGLRPENLAPEDYARISRGAR